MNVVRRAPARAPADAPAAAERPATEVDGRSQDSFFAELLQLPPPLPRSRWGDAGAQVQLRISSLGDCAVPSLS